MSYHILCFMKSLPALLLSLGFVGCSYFSTGVEVSSNASLSVDAVSALEVIASAYKSGYTVDKTPELFAEVDYLLQVHDRELSTLIVSNAFLANHERKRGNLDLADAYLTRGYSMIPLIVDEEWLLENEVSITKKDSITLLNYTQGIVIKERFERQELNNLNPSVLYQTAINSLLKAKEYSDSFLLDMNINMNLHKIKALYEKTFEQIVSQ